METRRRATRPNGPAARRSRRAVALFVVVAAAFAAAATSASEAARSPFGWVIGRWDGDRVAANGESAPLRARIDAALGGSAVVEDLVVRPEGSAYRGVTVQYPGPEDGDWTMVYASAGRAPAIYRGQVSTNGAEWRSTENAGGFVSRLVYERLDETRWRRTMLRSEDGGATWTELWRDEMRPAEAAP